MPRTCVLGWLAAVGVLLGCREEPATSTSTPTSTSTSTSTATPTPAATPTSPSAPATPPLAPLSRAVVVEPSGSSALSPASETVVDPGSTFQVELGVRIPDARLVLLDAADAHVPARSTHEVGDKTQLALAPAQPLAPGSRYVLRVEGATSRELRDGDRAWAPLSFPLLTAGTPPPPEPKKKPKAKAKRRR
ncbi:MAG TPA: hypothetical protein VFK90_05550 [Anaeromyxobacter sp.]|nr:hypothetical protein [Anaeromyxobacter sp.]